VGDLREAIATVAGVATLARAQGVGPKALRDLLPGLRASCEAVPATVAAALMQACEVVALSTGLEADARAALEALVAFARRTAEDVLAALENAELHGIGARTRLALQAACDRAVEDLARVRYSVELLQRASMSEPLPIALDDLLRELDGGELGGAPVELALGSGVCETVAVHPRLGTAVLLGALARARRLSGGTTFLASAVVHGDRVRLTLRGCTRDAHDEAGQADEANRALVHATVHVTVPDELPHDALVLGLAAASLAAPLVTEGEAVRLDLLRA
jgi:hypothetical protein